MTEQNVNPVAPVLTRSQRTILLSMLASLTLIMAFIGFNVYKASLPPVYRQVRDGSLIGRSLAAVRFWHGEPDPSPRVEGWDATYTFVEFYDLDGIAAIKTDADGCIVECRNFQHEQYARCCAPQPAQRNLLSP